MTNSSADEHIIDANGKCREFIREGKVIEDSSLMACSPCPKNKDLFCLPGGSKEEIERI